MFVTSLLSQLEYGKYNNCSTKSASCVSGGSGEKGGGGRGHSTYDYSSGDASYSGGAGHCWWGHFEGKFSLVKLQNVEAAFARNK